MGGSWILINGMCRNYWVFGLGHRPVFYKLENTTFRKLDLFPSSGEWETPTLLGHLEKASPVMEVSSKGPNRVRVSRSPEEGNRSSFRNAVFSSFENTVRWTLSKTPTILSVIHHRQNPMEYAGFLMKNYTQTWTYLRIIIIYTNSSWQLCHMDRRSRTV
jgi:hypothetical protein